MDKRDKDELGGTEQMTEVFESMGRICSQIEKHLDDLPASVVKSSLMRESIFCLRLGMTYYAEANRAVQVQAWFAATAIGAAALEAILLSKCLMQKQAVEAIPKFRNLKSKKTRDFRHFAEGLDLGKLLEIAIELSWFPDGGFPSSFRDVLAKHLKVDEMKCLDDLFAGEENVGKLCAVELRKYRNLLHPSVCLREERQPSSEAGLTGTFLLLAAVSALSNASQNEST